MTDHAEGVTTDSGDTETQDDEDYGDGGYHEAFKEYCLYGRKRYLLSNLEGKPSPFKCHCQWSAKGPQSNGQRLSAQHLASFVQTVVVVPVALVVV